MRICYLADAGSIHTQRWARYFVDSGHEVHLISERSFGDNNVENVKLYVLKKFRPRIRIVSFFINLLFNIIQVRTLIKKIKPDILHAHYITGWGFDGALSGFHPLVLTAWGSDVLVEPKKSKIMKWEAKCALRGADLITCDGWNTRQEMIKLGADVRKIHLIFHGVDTKEFNPGRRNRNFIKNLFSGESPIVISIRLFTPKNDMETLIKAIPLILKEVPNAKFIIGGEGPEGSYLRKLAESLGISNNTRFVGWIPHHELPKYLASSDVYVSTSLSEGGTSVSLKEAMACGLAPIVTDVGDNRKWIEDGENGFVIPIKSSELLGEKIACLLSSKELREKMGKANRQTIEEKSNYEREMGKMGKLYEELIKGYKR